VDEDKELVFVMVIAETRFADKTRRAPQKDSRAILRDLLDGYFSEDDLRDLCFEMSIDYDNLPGSGKRNKARELVLYCEHRNITADLIARCREQRPHADWPDA
jgi:hypothetical protein